MGDHAEMTGRPGVIGSAKLNGESGVLSPDRRRSSAPISTPWGCGDGRLCLILTHVQITSGYKRIIEVQGSQQPGLSIEREREEVCVFQELV